MSVPAIERIRQIMRQSAAFLLTLACLVLVHQRSADASSCGHYVKRLGPGFVPGKSIGADAALAAIPIEKSCPCQSPECRSLPQLPVPLNPDAPVRLSAPQELVAITDRSLAVWRTCSWLVGDFSVRPSRGYPTRLDRPPSL